MRRGAALRLPPPCPEGDCPAASAPFQRHPGQRLTLCLPLWHQANPSRLLFRPWRKSTRLNSSHRHISYAVFCLKKTKKNTKDGLFSVCTILFAFADRLALLAEL